LRAADRGAGRLNHYPDVNIAAPGGSRANLVVPAALLTLAAASAMVLVWSMRRIVIEASGPPVSRPQG